MNARATRFAPTPTGRLHLGNARTALLSHLAGLKLGLRNVLRVEDLDPRAIPVGCLEDQYVDLKWLGLRYDEGPNEGGAFGPYRQSERFDRYATTLAALNARALLYPCWCSRREVRDAARAPHASDEGPVYTGTCRPPTPTRLDDLDHPPKRRDRTPALRLNVAEALRQCGLTHIEFHDAIAGTQRLNVAGAMGDFVVRRVDGVAAYQIACSHDDVAMGCGLVLRGADLLPSTARQLLILRALGLPEPRYAHAGLVLDAHGTRLAKRDDAIALSTLRSRGERPEVVRALLARISGLPDTGDLDLLAQAFQLEALSAAPVRLTP